ncbi:hypothetical protein C8Q78DRAFT_1074877 [Trametes maxima]|nr:hypothetical protein C8Q78DRAFT_1074877 [Trametes maxima]
MTTVPGPTRVDDRDPGITFYQSPSNVNAPDISEQAAQYASSLTSYNNTLTYVSTSGRMSFSYTFTGNFVGVVGAILPWLSDDPMSAHFAVDGTNDADYHAVNVPAPGLAGIFYYNISSDSLSLGQHTLTCNITHATPDNPFLLDFIVYNTETSQTSSISQSTSTPPPTPIPTPSLSTSTSNSTTPISETSSEVPTSTSHSSKDLLVSHSFPLAPVIGGVAGGIVVLSAVLALLYYLWKRARRYGGRGEEHIEAFEPPEPKVPDAAGASMDPGTDILPTMPPNTGKGSIHSQRSSPFPAMHPPLASTHPTWLSYPSSGQWPYPGAEWGQPPYPSPPDTRTQTMYSTSVPWDQQSGYSPATWGQPGYLTHSTMSTDPLLYTGTVPTTSTPALGNTLSSPRPSMYNIPPAATSAISAPGSVLGEVASLRSGTPVIERIPPGRVPDAPPDGTHNPVPQAPPSLVDVSAAPRRSIESDGMRMHGGIINYDGKESRLTSAQPADGGDSPLQSDENGSSGKHSSASPPAYVP